MTTWEDVREQARDAGVDPDDPAFLKYAAEAPTDRSLYDQVTWLIRKARGDQEPTEKEVGPEEQKPVVSSSIEQVLTTIRDENIMR